MAYSRKNYLLKVKAVCELYDQMRNPDVPMARTYRRVIYPSFYISICTFYRYLNVNYKKELRELAEKQQPENPRQYTLF
ncbi:MAG: hypothetical protein E6Q66_09875 [Pedobacter sp.]|jgi:hypothetical protein|nr:MAG: hypothetical protein E6Q66_09875 [Pedobacter sp.]